MQFVKLQVSLRNNPDFRDLSDRAKIAYFGALMLTTDYEQEGVLRTWRGAISRDDLAHDLMVKPRALDLVLRELCNKKFLVLREDGFYEVLKFREKTETPQAAKMRVLREKRALEGLQDDVTNTVTVTEQLRNIQDHAVTQEIRDKSIPTPSVDKSTSVVGSERPKSKPDTSWVEPLRSSARAIAKRAISTLSPDERYILGRYHCLEFANCTKTEASNKAKATGVAAAFASMGRSQHYGDMTVGEYVVYARKVHEHREKTPWFDPWLIRAVVEWEQ